MSTPDLPKVIREDVLVQKRTTVPSVSIDRLRGLGVSVIFGNDNSLPLDFLSTYKLKNLNKRVKSMYPPYQDIILCANRGTTDLLLVMVRPVRYIPHLPVKDLSWAV